MKDIRGTVEFGMGEVVPPTRSGPLTVFPKGGVHEARFPRAC